MTRRKKGVLFVTDAILGIALLVLGMILLTVFLVTEEPILQSTYSSQDAVDFLATIKVGELESSYLAYLINGSDATDTTASVLEMIGIYVVKNETELARNLSATILEKYIPSRYGFEVLVGGESVYQRNKTTTAKATITSKRMVTGIELGKPVEGVTTQVHLTKILDRTLSSYAYFGGFEGQGNITKVIDDIPDDATIVSVEIEGDLEVPFNLSINDIHCNDMVPIGGNLTADYWNVTSCASSLVKGYGNQNNFTLAFASGTLSDAFVAGGFIRVRYETNQLINPKYYQLSAKNGSWVYPLPGINGLINVFSSFYVPGTLTGMEIYLNYWVNFSNSSQVLVFSVANTTVYSEENATPPQQIRLNSTYLGGVINYNAFTKSTVPFRFGFANFSEFLLNGNADVVLVNDFSGSMEWCMVDGYRETDYAVQGTHPITKQTICSYQQAVSYCPQEVVNRTYVEEQGKSFSMFRDHVINDSVTLNMSLRVMTMSNTTGFDGAVAGTLFFLGCNVTALSGYSLETDLTTPRIYPDTVTSGNVTFGPRNTTTFPYNGTTLNELYLATAQVPVPGIVSNVSYLFGFTDPENVDGFIVNLTCTMTPSFLIVNEGNLPVIGFKEYNATIFVGTEKASDPIDVFQRPFGDYTAFQNYTNVKKVEALKNAVSFFINTILNVSGNKIGLVDFAGPGFLANTTTGPCTNGTYWDLPFDGDDSSGMVTFTQTMDEQYVNYTHTDDGVSGWLNFTTNLSLVNQYLQTTWNQTWLLQTCICCGMYKAINLTANLSSADRAKFIIMMTDGVPTVPSCDAEFYGKNMTIPSLGEQYVGPGLSANKSANIAWKNYSIRVDTIGFGPEVLYTEFFLRNMSQSGNGTYFYAGSYEELLEAYSNLSEDILNVTYSGQQANVSSDITATKLYPDSYIKINFTPELDPIEYGEISLDFDRRNGNTNCSQELPVGDAFRVINAKITSYSGSYWTRLLTVNNNIAYNLTLYGQTYSTLGDPFEVTIPYGMVASNTTNNITLTIGNDPSSSQECSANNSLIYTGMLNTLVPYSEVYPLSEGCTWEIEHEIAGTSNLTVPENYLGSNACSFTSTMVSYNINDSYQDVVYQLLNKIDFNANNKTDIRFNTTGLVVEVSRISRVPYLHGPTMVEVRVWQ
ncbi:hypothetical protein HYW21_00105 [Candidatus Woesearchaeota archaeon]|nr:hypothetical protein [Candidatus Woesearchaeota archaeon]